MSDLRNEKIAVLAGGPSCEREISLISGKAVYDALTGLGLEPVWADPSEGEFISVLKREGVTLVFLALHGSFGEDGTIQEILEYEGLAYTGPGVYASRNAFDKARAQILFKTAGIRVPDFHILNRNTFLHAAKTFGLPSVVKPARAGSSVGITIVKNEADYEPACLRALEFSDEILVDQYIPGRELTVGILGETPLPVVEIVPGRSFYDFESKYRDCGTTYEVPAKLDERQTREVQDMALRAFHALKCGVMARADIILGHDGKPYLLEVNTIPGLTGKSLLPKAARAFGIDFPGLCVKILELSLKKAEVVK